jgi:hypothetical protein
VSISERLALLLTLVGFGIYVLGIFGRNPFGVRIENPIQPPIVSWSIWLLLDVIILAGMAAQHAVTGLMVGATAGAAAVVVAALVTKQELNWTNWDTFWLWGVAIALASWLVFLTPTFAVVVPVVVLAVGSIPAFRAAGNDVTNPTGTVTWLIWTIAGTIQCISIIGPGPEPNLSADLVQPMVFTSIAAAMTVWNLIGDL